MIRFDTFTDRHLRSVPVDVQRSGRQYAGGRAGSVLSGDPAAGGASRGKRYARIGTRAARAKRLVPRCQRRAHFGAQLLLLLLVVLLAMGCRCWS